MGRMGAVDDRMKGIDRNAALTAYDTAQAALETKMPELFNVLRPAPTPLSALMAGPNGAGLLRDDEALIVIVEPKVGQEAGSGFVFAVTRDRLAWSRIEMPAAAFQARLLRLQASLRNRTLLAESRDRFGDTAVASTRELYKALFGAGQVSELLATKRTWLIAPQGRLVGLSFTILPMTEPDHTVNGTADVLLFATQGLLAGGALDEPALALSPPLLRELPIDDSKDDGLLGVGEITALQLSARWVILSACNTASAEKENGPALSGLARAFLFAGARSLLVSYWAVNDAAAAALTTRTIAIVREGHTGPEALRRAMLELYERNPEANPSLWAPFMVIGSE